MGNNGLKAASDIAEGDLFARIDLFYCAHLTH